jgi:tetratricopeptide (TPR) repeat protein
MIMKNLKYASSLTRAENLMLANKLDQALTEYETVLKKDPKNFIAHANCAIIYCTLSETNKAIRHFESIKDKVPNNESLVVKYADCLNKNDKYDDAIEVLKKASDLNNRNVNFLCSIAAAYSKKEKHLDALSYAIKAIQIDPKNPGPYLQLGNVLFDLKRYSDAIIAFKTTIDLDQGHATARFNLASCYSSINEYDQAIEQYNLCLATPDLALDSIKQIDFFLSHIYLKKGELKKGWALHERGFINNTYTSRHPYRKFDVPKWEGQPLHGKRLLIWKEQGLGDMFMFMSCFPSVLELCDDIVIECDYRAIPLFQRSFPKCTVRRETYLGDYTTNYKDFDFHLPMGSLMHHFRQDLASFGQSKPYLSPNPDLAKIFNDRLSDNQARLKIGICWRSGVTSTMRNSNYLPLSDFIPVLTMPNCTFVNLQYGDCEKELSTLANDYGILLNNWPDIDQKNNLDAVAALISELDLVISAGTAVAQIAAAVGTKLILFSPTNSYALLGQDEYPWYPNIKSFLFTGDVEKVEIPLRIKKYVEENFEKIKILPTLK